MGIPIKINPPNDSDETKKSVESINEDSSRNKASAPNTDDGSRKPFKEILDATMAEKRPLKQPIKTQGAKTDDDEEKVSLLDLAAGTPVRESKPKPTITQTAVFRQDTDEPAVQEVVPDKPVQKPRTQSTAAVPDQDEDDTKVPEDTSPKVALNTAVDPKTVIGMAQAPVAPIRETTNEPQVTDASRAREILMQLAKAMVEKIQLIKAPGRTDTTLVLNHPPLFSGVHLHVSEFDAAKKQFNITFTNLTDPTARALIELKDNQLRLQQQLIDRGYTLQMITIEQKIPGLNSTEAGDVFLRQHETDQPGPSSDQDEGNVT